MKITRTNVIKFAVAALALVIITVVIGMAARLRSNAVVKQSEVYVPGGATYETLLDSLGADGERIRSMTRFRSAACVAGLDKNVRPGHYTLRPGMSYRQAANMFVRGLQTPVRLTFNNVRTLPQLAGRLGRQIEADSAAIAAVLLGDTLPAAYGFTPETFIAMFVPNTYEVYWTITPAALTERMNREYDRFWNQEREAKLAAVGLTRQEAVTLASIVYEETKMSDEMPAVAGVYLNRLRRGMPLQADPTVKYALGDPTLKRILFSHLEVDSPYNTYKYAGLPPGPICMPSVSAVDAVLSPASHKYLYFCARPDFSGYHNFAETLAAHNRNRQLWIAAINRAEIK